VLIPDRRAPASFGGCAAVRCDGTGFEPADPTGQRPQRCAVGLALATHARCLSAFVDIRRLDKSAFVCVSGRHSFAPVCEARVSNRHGTQSGPWPHTPPVVAVGARATVANSAGRTGSTSRLGPSPARPFSSVRTASLRRRRPVGAFGRWGAADSPVAEGPAVGSESDRRRRAALQRRADARRPAGRQLPLGGRRGLRRRPAPYLVGDYGERVTEARQDAGLQTQELADGSTSTSRTCSPSNRRARRRPASAGRLSAHSRSASTSSSPKTPDTGTHTFCGGRRRPVMDLSPEAGSDTRDRSRRRRRGDSPDGRRVRPRGQFPEDVWDTLADLDLTGLTVPEGLRRLRRRPADVRARQRGSRLRLARRRDGAVRPQPGHLLYCRVRRRGTQDEWLPAMVDGRPVGAFALSKPGAGSTRGRCAPSRGATAMSTSSTARSGGSRTGERSGVLVVFARTDPTTPIRSRSFSSRRRSAGLSVGEPEDKLGLRASDTTSLTFDGVRIPARYRLTDEGEG